MARDLAAIDLEIAALWRKYRLTPCSSAVLLEIDVLLDDRHALTGQDEMRHSQDIARVSEYGPADLGEPA